MSTTARPTTTPTSGWGCHTSGWVSSTRRSSIWPSRLRSARTTTTTAPRCAARVPLAPARDPAANNLVSPPAPAGRSLLVVHDALLVDLDGVLYLGDRPVNGAAAT